MPKKRKRKTETTLEAIDLPSRPTSAFPIRKGFLIISIFAIAILGFVILTNKDQEAKLPSKPEPKVEERITATPAIEITEDTYTVKPGDTLRKIAIKAYGDENAWVKIVQANNIRNPNRVEAGWVLRLPR